MRRSRMVFRKSRARLTLGIQPAEQLRRLIGCLEREAHFEPLAIEQRCREAVAVARMGHDADRLEQAPLLQHRSRSPHDAPHDRIAPLGKHREIGEEVRPEARAEVVVSRPDNVPGRQAGVRAHVAKYAVLARGRQRVAKQAPAVRVVGRPGPRAGQVLDRLLAHPFAAVERRPQHLRRALGEGGKQVPQLHRLHLDRRRGAKNDVRRVSGDGLGETRANCLGARLRARSAPANFVPCALRRGSRPRRSSWPARRALPRRRH